MKEEKSAEAFFSAELTKALGRKVNVAIMWLDFEDIDVPNPPYHKSVSQKIVENYFKEFNPVVAGFLVANVRTDGKTALVDGRHRREMAIRAGKKGWWFIATYGMELTEEAQMFRWFQARKNPNAAERLHGLLLEGDPTATQLRAAVHSSGCSFPFEDDAARKPITAIAALLWIYSRGGAAAVKSVLAYPMQAWFGEGQSFAAPMLKALWLFTSNSEVKGKLDREALMLVLKANDPASLVQRGRVTGTQERCSVACGLAATIRHEYNRRSKGRSRIAFNFARAESSEWEASTRARRLAVKKEALVAPPHLKELIESLRGKKVARPKVLINAAVDAARKGHTATEIQAVLAVRWEAVRRAMREGNGS